MWAMAMLRLSWRIGNDAVVSGVARFQANSVGSDCRVEGNANSDVQ